MCGRYDNLIARDAYRGLFKAKRLPEEILSAAMIVGEPNPLVGGIHDRIASDADVRRL
jgi:hypothetical protein